MHSITFSLNLSVTETVKTILDMPFGGFSLFVDPKNNIYAIFTEGFWCGNGVKDSTKCVKSISKLIQQPRG